MAASFLIINYESEESVSSLIKSIHKNFKREFEILVFDASSSYKTIDSKTQVFNLNKNIGFGSAINYLSLQAKYDYLFILNPDILIKHNLDEALEMFISQPIEYAVCSLNKAERLYKTPFFGRLLDKKRRFSSHAFVVNKEYFKILGGFDPNYFMYFEDNDFALKMRKFDLKTFYPSKTYVEHVQNYNFIEGFKRKAYYYNSFLYYLKKHSYLKYTLFYLPLKLSIFFLRSR